MDCLGVVKKSLKMKSEKQLSRKHIPESDEQTALLAEILSRPIFQILGVELRSSIDHLQYQQENVQKDTE